MQRAVYPSVSRPPYRILLLVACDTNASGLGACLVSKDGKILGRGHNMRVQKGSASLHVGLHSSARLIRTVVVLDAS
jgi:tRNA(Arg) A34 adenosine deaminase TadA